MQPRNKSNNDWGCFIWFLPDACCCATTAATSGDFSCPLVFGLLLCQGARKQQLSYATMVLIDTIASHNKSFAMTLQLRYAFVPPSKSLQWHLWHACEGYNLKNNQPVQWCHQPMPQQGIHGTCCSTKSFDQLLQWQHQSMQQVICGHVMAMPPQVSNATYVTLLKISFGIC